MNPVVQRNVMQDPVLQFNRTINNDLEEIGQVLEGSPLQDNLSQAIRTWHEQFTLSLRGRVDRAQVTNTFLDLLQELLRNPITHEPLDDRTWLGSDGFAYGFMFLRVYTHRAAPDFRNRSPVSPDNPARFTKRPHTIIRHLIPWLRRVRPEFHPVETERLFNQLPPENALNRIDRLLANRAAQEQNVLGAIDQVAQVAGQVADGVFEAHQQNFNQAIERNHGRLDAVEAQELAVREGLNQQIANLEARENQIEQENLRLQNNLEELHDDVQEERRDIIRLQRSVNQVRQAAIQVEKSKSNALLTAVVAVTIAAVGCWALQQAFAAAGSTATATTSATPGGGAFLKFALPW